MLFYIVCMTGCAIRVLSCIITDWITEFSVFVFQFLAYFTSKVSELKTLHYYVQTRH